jgi:hypothetical protein
MLEMKRPVFFPLDDSESKPNSKRFYRVDRDGSIVEKVFLHVPDDRERERLIFVHYLRLLGRHFIVADVGIRVLSRDDPWDFKIKLSTGRILNVEITAIADSPQHFEINKREERLAGYVRREQISLRELKKLVSWFPDLHLEPSVEDLEARGTEPDQLIENPLKTEKSVLLSKLLETQESLEDQLRTAVEKKLSKPHAEKGNTMLIIDNRSSAYDAPDYFRAAEALHPYLGSTPFPEIWFYTGYYSDSGGNEAEFTFAPLKISDDQAQALRDLVARDGLDDHRRLIW